MLDRYYITYNERDGELPCLCGSCASTLERNPGRVTSEFGEGATFEGLAERMTRAEAMSEEAECYVCGITWRKTLENAAKNWFKRAR